MHEIIQRRLRCASIAVIPTMVMACEAADGAPPEGLRVRDGGLVTLDSFRAAQGDEGFWINNGLTDPGVGGIDPEHPLDSPQGLSEEVGVLADPSTRIAAAYLVECALPKGASIVKQVDGETILLDGLVGLAPEWQDEGCDEGCQEWVSACLLARTNVSGKTVVISLRAEHPEIGFGGAEGYGVYEASFFGNVFDPTAERAMCRGGAEALAVAGDDGRTCSVDPDRCGFEAYDDCEALPRCEFVSADDGMTAVDCKPEGGATTRHTISVYVEGGEP